MTTILITGVYKSLQTLTLLHHQPTTTTSVQPRACGSSQGLQETRGGKVPLRVMPEFSSCLCCRQRESSRHTNSPASAAEEREGGKASPPPI